MPEQRPIRNKHVSACISTYCNAKSLRANIPACRFLPTLSKNRGKTHHPPEPANDESRENDLPIGVSSRNPRRTFPKPVSIWELLGLLLETFVGWFAPIQPFRIPLLSAYSAQSAVKCPAFLILSVSICVHPWFKESVSPIPAACADATADMERKFPEIF